MSSIPISTPTPIPIDDLPPEFAGYLYEFFQNIILGLKSVIIPFTHASIWDFLIWTIVLGAAIKAIKLMYGKGDSTKHE